MDLRNYHDWIAERQQLLERIKELEAENAELFRSLFKRREDVFARRWYSKASGKGGYI